MAPVGECQMIQWNKDGSWPDEGEAKVDEHWIDPKWNTGASLVTHKEFGCTLFKMKEEK